MDGNEITLNIAGKPLTFTAGAATIEACRDRKIGNRFPPGPCKGKSSALPKGSEIVKKAIAKQQKAERAKVAKQLMLRMAAGEKFDVDPDTVPDLLGQMNGSAPMNLAKAQITGEKNKNLFQHHLRDIPRDKMPALPDTVQGLMPFIQELGRLGIKAELVDLDPRDIQATQSELSAPKVAKMAGFMKSGWKPGGAMIVSQENALGDGHHRWAGAAMAALMHEQGVEGYKPVRVTALKVDAPIDDLLAVMERFSGPKKSLTEAP